MRTDSRRQPKLRDQFRNAIRVRHYSVRTEKTYWYWIRYFIRFHRMRHPSEMAAPQVSAFLTWLATERDVAAATQNQALNALVFLYRHVLEAPLGEIKHISRVKRPAKLPTVLSHEEAIRVIGYLPQPHKLIISLIYGAGLRVTEAARLRVKDLDFSQRIMEPIGDTHTFTMSDAIKITSPQYLARPTIHACPGFAAFNLLDLLGMESVLLPPTLHGPEHCAQSSYHFLLLRLLLPLYV